MSDAQYQTALALFGQGRHAEGAQLLGQAAHVGHVPSMSLLGGLLLAGRGVAPDPATGIRLIMAAAERGGGFACAMAGAVFASGSSGQPDWKRGLDFLQRSAELGFPAAQAQLRLLSGFKAGTDWKRLRRSIDVAAWRKSPAPRTLSEDPLIQAFPGVISPAICEALIEGAKPHLGPAKVYDNLGGGHTTAHERRNSAADFGIGDVDLLLLAVRERLCALAGLPAVNADGSQALHYKVGERFTPHFDFFDPAYPGHALLLAQGGQRVATMLLYLNDEGLEGGETEFPLLNIRHRGAQGDVLMFRNLDAEGQPNPRTLHAGLPPTAGEKWMLSTWVRDRAAPGIGDPHLIAAMTGR
jgi:hypothetical protein